MNCFSISQSNWFDEDLQIGVVDPVVIENLYKRLNRDLRANPGKRPIDLELNVKDKAKGNKSYKEYSCDSDTDPISMSTCIDYQVFESLCGVFTTVIYYRYDAWVKLALTISDAIKYGIARRTDDPDEIEICMKRGRGPDLMVYDTEDIYKVYNKPLQLTDNECDHNRNCDSKMHLFHPDFRVSVEIIPDPVMTKNSMKS